MSFKLKTSERTTTLTYWYETIFLFFFIISAYFCNVNKQQKEKLFRVSHVFNNKNKIK